MNMIPSIEEVGATGIHRSTKPTTSSHCAMSMRNSSNSSSSNSRRRRGSTGTDACSTPIPVQTRPVQRRMRRFSLPAGSTPQSDLLVFVNPRSEKPLKMRRLRRCHTDDGTCTSSFHFDTNSAGRAQLNSRWDTEGYSTAADIWEVDAMLSYACQISALERTIGTSPPRMPRREAAMSRNPTSLNDLLPRQELSSKAMKASPTLPPRMPRRSSLNDVVQIGASLSACKVDPPSTSAMTNATFPTRKTSNPKRVSRRNTPLSTESGSSLKDYMEWLDSSLGTSKPLSTEHQPPTSNTSPPPIIPKDYIEKDPELSAGLLGAALLATMANNTDAQPREGTPSPNNPIPSLASAPSPTPSLPDQPRSCHPEAA